MPTVSESEQGESCEEIHQRERFSWAVMRAYEEK